MPTINSYYNIEKDAQNRREAVNRSMNWTWYKNMDNEAQIIFKKITWIPFKESLDILVPFLEKRYNDNKAEIDDAAKQIKTILDDQKEKIFELMEKLTKKPIFNDSFTIRYTTCKRWPYNRRTWEIWVMEPSKIEFRKYFWTQSFIHELLHFQTHKYYEKIAPMDKLDKSQFNLLKESLTFLINYEFPWINKSTDNGYPQHQEFRKKLEEYRISLWDKKDFEKLIEFWCNKILA